MDVSAQNAADFVEKMHEVQAAVDVCREVSDVLEKEISHFAVRGTVQGWYQMLPDRNALCFLKNCKKMNLGIAIWE